MQRRPIHRPWPPSCRPTANELSEAICWVEEACLELERQLELSAGGTDAPALRSKIGKLHSGARLLRELARAQQKSIAPKRVEEPIRFAGRDADGSASADHVIEHLSHASVLQVSAALNANVFRSRVVHGRRLHVRSRHDDPNIVELGWTDANELARSSRPGVPPILTRRGERFRLIQFFNAGTFQAAFTAGVFEQAALLGMVMNDRDPADGDLDSMKRRIEDAIADTSTAGCIVHSGPAVELQPLIRRAREQGKAVVTSIVPSLDPLVPSLLLDDVGTGRTLASELLSDLGGATAHVLLVGGGERELLHMRLRQQGCIDVFGAHREITFTEISDTAHWRAADGSGAIAQIVGQLKRDPQTRAVVAFYDDASRHAANAIDLAGCADCVALYGVDLSDPEIESMRGHAFWRASVAFDPFALGAAAARMLAARMRLENWADEVGPLPAVVAGELIRRSELMTVRDQTARGVAMAFPETTRGAARVVGNLGAPLPLAARGL